MNQESHVKSIMLKLTSTGLNQTITLPQMCDVLGGQILLKSYVVQFPANNTDLNDIQLNIRGINLEQNTNNHSEYLCLPVMKNSTTHSRTTINNIDLVLQVSGHRLNRTIKYDLVDENFTTTWGAAGAPSAVYLYFQYNQSGI